MSSFATFFSELAEIYNILGNTFGSESVVLSGSSAIFYLVMKHPYFENSDMKNSVLSNLNYDESNLPADFDFFIVRKLDITNQRLGPYVSDQSAVGSKTFYLKNNLSDDLGRTFDLISIPSISYFEIDGVKIIKPSLLLDNYLDNRRTKDSLKIKFLKTIIDHFDSYDYESLSIQKKRSIMFDLDETSSDIPSLNTPCFDTPCFDTPRRKLF
jgi:hypothetical protein